jgi:predicted TIM-barrel fold metal-dependent hydrolase
VSAPANPEAPSLRERALAGLPLVGFPVVDAHCHLGAHPLTFLPRNAAEGLVRTLDRIGITQACVFSTLATRLDARGGNTLSLAAARAFPDRLLAYALVDPYRSEHETRAELQRCFDEGIRGIKLHTGLSEYPFDGPGYAPAFAFAHEHRLPLISHGVGTPETLRRVARAHPHAHLIVAHAGGGGAAFRPGGYYQVAAEEPNVYLDTASSTGGFGVFAAVARAAGARKLVYGSDMPVVCATYQIGRVLLAPIPEDDKRRILGGTLAALLATRC